MKALDTQSAFPPYPGYYQYALNLMDIYEGPLKRWGPAEAQFGGTIPAVQETIVRFC